MKPTRTAFRSSHAFTLLEVLAVLAILSVFASVMAPATIRALNRSAGMAEEQNLAVLANGLAQYITLERRIPGPAGGDWENAVAGEVGLSLNQVRSNAKGNQRLYLSNIILPYEQDIRDGSSPLFNPRVIVLSSLGKELGATSLDFEELWEGNHVSAGWTGREDNLIIKRIHLGSFFHRIALNNTHNETPLYTVDGLSVTPSFPEIHYLLSGTELRLSDHEGLLQLIHIVRSDKAFTYSGDQETGQWRQ